MSRSGVLLGKYRLVERLDGVDSGAAHLGNLVGIEGFEKPVVVWSFRASPTHDAKLIHAVMLEAKLAATLCHGNIAQVLDLDLVDGVCVLVTEYASGRTLDAVLRSEAALPWTLVARIAIEVSAALAYAHGRRNDEGELLRIVHRRLSPSRIVLGDAGHVKVTGFGASSAWMTPDAYRAPEEGREEPVDGRADVFALSAIIRDCLSPSGAPQPLLDLLERASQPYPERRPTATIMHAELTRILHAFRPPVMPIDIATVAKLSVREQRAEPEPSFTDYLIRTSGELEARGALFEALDRLEVALDSMGLSTTPEGKMMLQLYERVGRLSVEAHVGERGLMRMTRALDLADSLGCDEHAALFCELRGELLAQADRMDESRDWFERAVELGR